MACHSWRRRGGGKQDGGRGVLCAACCMLTSVWMALSHMSSCPGYDHTLAMDSSPRVHAGRSQEVRATDRHTPLVFGCCMHDCVGVCLCVCVCMCMCMCVCVRVHLCLCDLDWPVTYGGVCCAFGRVSVCCDGSVTTGAPAHQDAGNTGRQLCRCVRVIGPWLWLWLCDNTRFCLWLCDNTRFCLWLCDNTRFACGCSPLLCRCRARDSGDSHTGGRCVSLSRPQLHAAQGRPVLRSDMVFGMSRGERGEGEAETGRQTD